MKAALVLVLPACLLALGACTAEGPPAPVESFEAISEPENKLNPDRPVQRPNTHTVASGETLINIAAEYGLSYRELARWNLITNPNQIKVGQRLRLVPPKYEPEVAVPAVQGEKIEQTRPQLRRTTEQVARTRKADQAAQPAANQAAPSVQRRQAILGNKSAQLEAPASELISTPRALKLPYSTEARERMLGLSFAASPANLPASNVPEKKRTRDQISWIWPATGEVVSEFSEDGSGIDIVAERGTPVLASADGEVIYVGSGLKGFGQAIILRHRNEYVSVYAHNDKIFVAERDTVKLGDTIAAMGDSGASSVGLHFQIRRGAEHYNPRDYLPAQP